MLFRQYGYINGDCWNTFFSGLSIIFWSAEIVSMANQYGLSRSKDNHLQMVELLGHLELQIVVISSLQTVSSMDPSEFAVAKMTHCPTIPQQPSDSLQPSQRLLLSGDVHTDPTPLPSIHVLYVIT